LEAARSRLSHKAPACYEPISTGCPPSFVRPFGLIVCWDQMCVRFRVSAGTILRIAVNNLAMLLAMVVQCTAAPPWSAEPKPFIECDRVELIQAVPELAGIQFEPSQDRLDGLLRATGEQFRELFANRVGISAAEEIHEMRFEDSMVETSRRESFRYVVRPVAYGVGERLEELRTDTGTGTPTEAAPKGDFLITGHFFRLLHYMLPEYREQSRFRYLGRWTARGREYFVVAFAQRSGGTEVQSNFPLGDGRTALLQGLVWIDASSNRVTRLRLDLLRRIDDNSLTTEIFLVPVNFQSISAEFWLPARVTAHVHYPGGDVHSVHRYSDYRLEGAGEVEKRAGLGAAVPAGAEDPWELLDRAISIDREHKPGEAIPVFREALSLNPDMPAGQYNLAAALHATGDLAGAEAELREALKRVPNSGPVHNFLGILMFKRGDAAGAVTEFRSSTQLQPKDATVHFNLAQALEKLGDQKAALEEYRTASTLVPDNASFKQRFEQREQAVNKSTLPTADTTIKVDVRQVLVPVIVTDRAGHHIGGLKQADFTIFDDGVEQKISAFSVENAGILTPATAPASVESSAPRAVTAARPTQIRRTYVICIDSFHSSFADLVHVREALSKLFRAEQAGDSQYVLVAVGTSTQMLQSPTKYPEAVLKTVASKDFEKVFLGSGHGSTQAELLDFRSALDRARTACDSRDSLCRPLKDSLPSQAQAIASRERMNALGFLSQFHSLVEMLARGTERRSIILLSDGFQLVAGREAYELLAAYFPDMTSLQLREERVQDLEPILRLAANSNIPIYTIDSRGLYTSGFYEAANPGSVAAVMPAVVSVMDQNATAAGQTLSEIAAATGGTAFKNSNNILNGLERAFADGRQYYMLAYVPASSKSDGKFHSISVRLRDSKMLVSAKRGYWAVAN
jgi:VWFA-related protein